jgi:orotate phosphoribosyltransferase
MSADRDRLLIKLKREAYREGTFTLASGKTSDFFIDCKRVMLTAEGHVLAGVALFEEVLKVAPGAVPLDGVAGVALGGCPLASAVSVISYQRERPLNALYVRKEAKDHGTKSLIEGAVTAGGRVVLLEDVLTTGGSSKLAVDHLRAAGYRVDVIVALVDRREGAIENLAAHGVSARALFGREDFVC